MKLKGKVTRASNTRVSSWLGAIQSTSSGFCTIENSHEKYFIYQKGSTQLSTLCTTKVRSTSESHIYVPKYLSSKFNLNHYDILESGIILPVG